MTEDYVYRRFECPHCKGQFNRFQFRNDVPPNFCDLCGADVTGKKKKARVIKKERLSYPNPHKRNSTIAKTADSVYRGMENASNDRIHEAAALLGCDARSLSAMKMTDMKDNLREGDLSGQSHAPTKTTELVGDAPVFQLPGAPQGMNAFQNNTAGVEYAKTVGSGPSPFAGNKIRELVTSTHGARSHSVARAGQLNKV